MQWNNTLRAALKVHSLARGRLMVFLYVAVVAIPAVALVYLGLTAFKKQRVAIGQLTSANLVLAGERLAADFERNAEGQSEGLLTDPAVRNIAARAHHSMTL